MRTLLLLALVLLVQRPATAAPPQKILLYPLDYGCTDALTPAVRAVLGVQLPLAVVQVRPLDRTASCMGEECANRVRLQYPAEELRDTLLIGGQADEQEGYVRYRIWAYDFESRRSAFADKWLSGRPELAALGDDIAGSFRALIEDFEAACCLTATAQREQRLADCALSVPLPSTLPVPVVIFNRPTLAFEERKKAEDLQAFHALGSKTLDHTLAQVSLEGYSVAGGETVGRLQPQQQATWLHRLHLDQVVRVEWTGISYSVSLCHRAGAVEPLACREHRSTIEDRPAEPLRMRHELLLRIRDLVAQLKPLPPTVLCQRPFAIGRCLAPKVPPAAEPALPAEDELLDGTPLTPQATSRPVPIPDSPEPPPHPLRTDPPIPLLPMTRPAVSSPLRHARNLAWSSLVIAAATTGVLGGLALGLKGEGYENRTGWYAALGASGGLTLLTLPVLIAVQRAYRQPRPPATEK